MLQLTVVNEMLGSMGEVGLASLTDTHPFLPNALSTLDNENKRIQAQRWWFNEEQVTIDPNSVDGSIYLPGDVLEVVASDRNYVQRGSRLYNKDGNTYVFDQPQTITIRRLLDFEDLPELPAQYIAASAVVKFQSNYDGDSAKRNEKIEARDEAKILLNAEETRQRRANQLSVNYRLARLKVHFSRYRYGANARIDR